MRRSPMLAGRIAEPPADWVKAQVEGRASAEFGVLAFERFSLDKCLVGLKTVLYITPKGAEQ